MRILEAIGQSIFKPRNTLPYAVFFLTLGCGLFLVQQNHDIRVSEETQVVQQVLTTQESELARRLSYMLSSTYFLAQEVARTQGELDGFNEFAESILQRMDGISNLQLAPAGVISHIHPLAGNEAAIGHDVLNDDSRRDEARDAIRDRRLTLAGPFTLLQGGVAVVGRNPVFLSQADGTEIFWGFTSALILLEDLISGSGLSGLPTKDYVYELSRIIPETGERSIFASSGDPTGLHMQSIEISVPNGNWTLRIGLTASNEHHLHAIAPFGVLLITLIFTFFTRRIVNEPEKLRQKVAEQTQDLHEFAYYDALTGLPNRHQFNETLLSSLQRCKNSENELALILLDLDNFKEVNDTLGHDMGDLLLIQSGERLSTLLPEWATLARLGGDEFTVIMVAPNIAELAEHVSQKIITAIAKPFYLQGNLSYISASIGIVSASDANHKPGDLFKCADQAMYQVKRNGRGGFVHYSESIQEEIALRSSLINDLRKATHDGSLQLLYQPIISTESGNADKAEALLRWHHPTRGTICPSIFIPLAEESGLINELGDWVFNEAIQQATLWRKNYNKHFQVSINVSPLQFQAEGKMHNWIKAVKESDYEPDCLLLEITEGVVLENNQSNNELLLLLQQAGFRIALDDFGTGYSSLSYLKMLHIDYLKIDRSFVKSLSANSSDLVLCNAILSIAKGLHFSVVAEGVETKAQQKLLCDIGCQYIQGFLYSKPITGIEFERLFFNKGQFNNSLRHDAA